MRKSALLSSALLFGVASLLAPQARADITRIVGFPNTCDNIMDSGPCNVSPNGSYAVGSDSSGAAIWDITGSRTALPGSSSSFDSANAMASNGAIVGTISDVAVYWANSSASPTGLLDPGTYGSYTQAGEGISANGAYVVGNIGGSRGFNPRGFIYRVSDANVTTLDPSGSEFATYAAGVTNDGSVVIGQARDNGTNNYYAAYWYNGGSGTTYTETYLPGSLSNSNSIYEGAHAIRPTAASLWAMCLIPG